LFRTDILFFTLRNFKKVIYLRFVMNNQLKMYNLLRYIAILGNFLYFFWILYNGIDEGFKGTIIMITSYAGLMLLLILNITIFYLSKKKN
jgi:hypothetical protein